MTKQFVNLRTGSDVYPFEVIEQSASGKTLTLREMDYVAKEGAEPMSNDWTYISNPNNRVLKVSKRKNGRYYKVGQPMNWWSGGTLTDAPHAHYDYSF
jgi:hypothetical protein